MASGTVILPICSFGNIFFYQQFVQSDEVWLDPWENYPKQTYRNRYEILNHNGKQRLTIPVVGQKGEKIPFKEIEIDYRENWPIIHWRSIVSAYQRSPHFEFYQEELEEHFFSQPKHLIDFSLNAHRLILDWLGIGEKAWLSKRFIENPGDMKDFRGNFKPSKSDFTVEPYLQVFADRHGFTQNLSVLDLIFNLGPESHSYLENA